MIQRAGAMTYVGRRGVIPPPANLYRIPLMHVSGLLSAGRQWADAAELRTPRLTGWAKRLVEILRQRIFAGRPRPAEHYDEAQSEMSAFLRSCRRIFWALAAFSGMSNLLM